MFFSRRAVQILSLFMLLSMLSGCLTTYHGSGVVVGVQEIEPARNSYQMTQAGVKSFGTAGVFTGACFGGLVGFVAGLYVADPGMMIVATLIGAGSGALVVGIAGAAVGGAAGLVVDKTTQAAAVYEFVVKSDRDAETMTITQKSTVIPLNTKVRILERNGEIFIRR